MPTHPSQNQALGQRPLKSRAQARPVLLAALLTLIAFMVALPAGAQDKGVSFSLLGGIGGSPDSDNYTGSSFQVSGSWEWRINTLAQIRVGAIDLELDRGGFFQGADLTWVSVATEYRNDAVFYDSGITIGVGLYRLESSFVLVPGIVAPSNEEESVGLHLGVSGHFKLKGPWSLPVEFMGHYADFDQVQFFFTAQVGLSYSF